MAQRRRWLITGATTGLGAALAQAVVDAGDIAVVTSRDAGRAQEFAQQIGAIGIGLDPADGASRNLATAQITEQIGGVDVLVNNAGYGLLGAVEETDEDEARAQIEANFFGPALLTRQLIGPMRERGSGCIVNVTSVSGVRGAPGSGYYAASKFALEGWSDSLRSELAQYGVHVMVVEPGSFRTQFFGSSRKSTRQVLGVYRDVEARRSSTREQVGQQPGDPAKGAAAIMCAVDAQHQPERLILGADAVARIESVMNGRLAELEQWRDVSTDVAFDEVGT